MNKTPEISEISKPYKKLFYSAKPDTDIAVETFFV